MTHEELQEHLLTLFDELAPDWRSDLDAYKKCRRRIVDVASHLRAWVDPAPPD